MSFPPLLTACAMQNSVPGGGGLHLLSALRLFSSLLLLFSLSRVLADDTRTCYTPAGEERDPTIYRPCSNATVSMCCAISTTGNDQCNPDGIEGLCYNYVLNEYWRESCTDVSSTPVILAFFQPTTWCDEWLLLSTQHTRHSQHGRIQAASSCS